MRLTLKNCVGATAAPTHAQKPLITDSDSWQLAPTNPLFSAFDFGGGRASDSAFTIGGDGDVNDYKDDIYNVKNGKSILEWYREKLESYRYVVKELLGR